MKQDKNGIKQSLNDSFKALGNVLKEAYALAPFAVIVLGFIAITIVWVTLHWGSLMMGTATLLVVFVSLCIFGSRDNFGEAMLSLIGGLLTLFALVWTPGRYITFMAAWIGFALAALLISSIKLAAKNEEIYRMASLRLADRPEDHATIEKKLREIVTSSKLKMLSPIERAEVIRVLAFRKLPIRYFGSCLHAVETLSIITQCDIKTIALFFADVLLSFSPESEIDARRLLDTFYDIIKDVPVPPEEFFQSFESCRRLLVSQTIAPKDFLQGLQSCLESGISSNDIYDEMVVQFKV